VAISNVGNDNRRELIIIQLDGKSPSSVDPSHS